MQNGISATNITEGLPLNMQPSSTYAKHLIYRKAITQTKFKILSFLTFTTKKTSIYFSFLGGILPDQLLT